MSRQNVGFNDTSSFLIAQNALLRTTLTTVESVTRIMTPSLDGTTVTVSGTMDMSGNSIINAGSIAGTVSGTVATVTAAERAALPSTEGTTVYDSTVDALYTNDGAAWQRYWGTTSATGVDSIAMGAGAGLTSQGDYSVAIGNSAGQTSQEDYSIAIGNSAGQTSQSGFSVAIGLSAGNTGQGASAVAVGQVAGQSSQGVAGVAVGPGAGYTGQGAFAVAVGPGAGNTGQGASGVAVGTGAGNTGQGESAVAIGNSAGQTSQPANSIVLNATGVALTPGQVNSTYISPIRDAPAAGHGIILQHKSTGEVVKGIQVASDPGATDGEIGSITWSDTFLYIRTTTGWKKVAITAVA